MKRIIVTTLFGTLLVCGPALAGEDPDLAVVKAFYSQLLSDPSAADIDARAADVLVEDWVSIPPSRAGMGRAGFVKGLRGFGAVLPDLKWEPQEILQDGNRFIVRSKATGTPVKPFFGIEPSGRSFEIMSIDVHTVENGRIVTTYHIEEWHRAMRQLRAP